MEVKGGRRTKGLKITSWLPETAEEKRYLQHLITVTPPLHQNWCVYAKKHFLHIMEMNVPFCIIFIRHHESA